jgi:hypothetical protein
MKFIKFVVRWVGSNLSIPFWVVGHIHLTINVYEDIYEILSSVGMNLIVTWALWLDWKDHTTRK